LYLEGYLERKGGKIVDELISKHFENLGLLYNDASIQIPNTVFNTLSMSIKNKKQSTNAQQTSFAYSYLVVISFLYKYTHFIDIDNGVYIQNADIKEFLGYNRLTKTIDSIIKKGGILDNIGLTSTTKEYPISFYINNDEKINNIPLREFISISDMNENCDIYYKVKEIVKNRNFQIKEPKFLFENDGDMGTLYNYSNTHKITIKELITFLSNGNLDNIDFYLYCFLKSKCKGWNNNTKDISLNYIITEIGISRDAFYIHLNKLKEMKFIEVTHKEWVMSDDYSSMEANEYHFKGVNNND
jgi:hypothetical protein